MKVSQTESPTTQQQSDTTASEAPTSDRGGAASAGILQRKIQRRALQRRAEGQEAGGDAHKIAEQGVAGAGGAMPHMDTIQRAFGRHDVSGIQAHTDEHAGAAAKSIGAEAYATGNHVAFAGAPSLHTAAHEAAHVVQQRSGVSLSGGVGHEGDAYERHADAVADAVVAGRSAEGLLDQHAGAGPSVQRRALQLKDNNAKTSDQQLHHLADGGGAVPAANAGATPAATSDPFKHPYWPTFLSRVQALFAAIGAPPGSDPQVLARQIWSGIMEGMHDAHPQMQDPKAYSNHASGYVQMDTPQFQAAMHSFDGAMSHLQDYTSTQFAKAKSFGFWSTPAGKELTEAVCDLTLETSGIGGLFDGLPSLDGKQGNATGAKWDAELWAALSNAYATAVANQLKRKGTKVHVCIGPKARAGNIFEMIESKAMEKKLLPMGMTLKQVTRFHAAATHKATPNKCDFTAHDGDFKGTAWSGDDLATARTKADEYNAAH